MVDLPRVNVQQGVGVGPRGVVFAAQLRHPSFERGDFLAQFGNKFVPTAWVDKTIRRASTNLRLTPTLRDELHFRQLAVSDPSGGDGDDAPDTIESRFRFRETPA